MLLMCCHIKSCHEWHYFDWTTNIVLIVMVSGMCNKLKACNVTPRRSSTVITETMTRTLNTRWPRSSSSLQVLQAGFRWSRILRIPSTHHWQIATHLPQTPRGDTSSREKFWGSFTNRVLIFSFVCPELILVLFVYPTSSSWIFLCINKKST